MRASTKFAHAAHDSIGQVRKYTGLPYWTHTDEVRRMVEAITSDEVAIQAADLHDVLEDVAPYDPSCHGPFCLPGIYAAFGAAVTLTVLELKNAFPHARIARAVRKRMEAIRLAGTSNRARIIKLCDCLSNLRGLEKLDPEFYRIYAAEKALLYPAFDSVVNRSGITWRGPAWDYLKEFRELTRAKA